jgi:D-alanine transaminase
MSKKFFINSKYVDYKDATIHVEDRGLQFADSVYEVVAFYNKKLIDLKFHFDRLRFSLSELNINYNFEDRKITKIFNKLIEINSLKNGILYLQITRGVQPRNHNYNNKLKPTLIIYTQNKKFNLPNKNYKGVEVITHEDLRWSRRDIKTTNLLPNILAEKKAHLMNAYTAILIKNNKVTEGCHSNIWIIKNKKIFTHPSNTNILEGITKTVLKSIISNHEYRLSENSFTINRLYSADEVFLTSSGSFITPILKIDNKLINNGKIGNITLKLAKLFIEQYE